MVVWDGQLFRKFAACVGAGVMVAFVVMCMASARLDGRKSQGRASGFRATIEQTVVRMYLSSYLAAHVALKNDGCLLTARPL